MPRKPEDVYRRLGGKIDGLTARTPWNGAFHAILKELYTVEEADVVARMPHSLSSLGRVSRVTGVPEARLRGILDNLCSKVSVQPGKMEITSRSEEGNVKEEVSTEVEGEEIVIGFNSKYIMDVLKAVSDEEIVLEMTTSTSPCLIKPVEGDQFINLVLPVRIVAN